MHANVNDYQVGGTHYQAQVQHWDFIEKNGLGYLVGCATKYVARNRKKHKSPIEDLGKAIHYIDKLIDLYATAQIAPRDPNLPWPVPVELFCRANALTPVETDIVTTLASWQNGNDLSRARAWTDGLLQWATDEFLGKV